MNSNTTRWLVALALGCFAYIYFYERHSMGSKQRAELSARLLPDLVPAEVTSLEIVRTNPVVRVARTNETWRVTLPVLYPAQSTGIENLLDTLASLRRSGYIPAKELMRQTNGLAEFGLEAPRFNVIVLQHTNRTELRVGGRAPLGEQLYVQVVGREGVYVTDSALLERFPRSADDWRDRTLLDVKGLEFDRLYVQAGTLSYEVQRTTTNREWRLTKPMQARANSPLLNHVAQILRTAQVSQFVTDAPGADLEPFGLQPPQLEMTLGRGTNDLLSLKFGHSLTNSDLIHVQRAPHGNVVLASRELMEWIRPPFDRFRDPHLITFSTAAVERIEVRGADTFALQRQTNGAWRILEPFSQDADPALVMNLITNLNALRTELVQGVVTDFASYGLTPTNRQYTLKTANGSTNPPLAQIEFGNRYETNKIFVRRTDENSVYATGLADSLRLPQAAFALRDRRVWNFATNQVVGVAITHKGRTQKLLRTAAGQWRFAAGPPDAHTPLALDETLYRLGQLQAVAWIARGDDQPARFGIPEAAHQLSLEIKAGETTQTLTVQFGQTSPWNTPYASAIVDGQPVVFGFPARVYDIYEIVLRELNLAAPGATL